MLKINAHTRNQVTHPRYLDRGKCLTFQILNAFGYLSQLRVYMGDLKLSNSAPDSRGHPENGGQHGCELEEDILVYGGWQEELKGFDL